MGSADPCALRDNAAGGNRARMELEVGADKIASAKGARIHEGNAGSVRTGTEHGYERHGTREHAQLGKAPEAPASMRAGLQSQFPAKPPLRLPGVPPRWILAFAAAAGALALFFIARAHFLSNNNFRR